jgi:hypothetical protein
VLVFALIIMPQPITSGKDCCLKQFQCVPGHDCAAGDSNRAAIRDSRLTL